MSTVVTGGENEARFRVVGGGPREHSIAVGRE